MTLKELLLELKRTNTNKVFLFFKDEDGELKNVIYQDDCFYRLVNGEARRFNPLLAYDAILRVQAGVYKPVGFGQYAQPLKIKKGKGVVA